MTRPIDLTKEQAARLGLSFELTEKGAAAIAKKKRAPRIRPPTLREKEICTHRYMHGSLLLIIPTPPRTKKNSTYLGIRQSNAYRKFAQDVAATILPRKLGLKLPLPRDLHFNLRALFYVDVAGERADLFGLLQATADALQDAGVLENDWQFRSCDGSRIFFGDRSPRVEVLIDPLDIHEARTRASRISTETAGVSECMAKTALIAPKGLMYDRDGKTIPRRMGFLSPGHQLACRFGHDVKRFATLHEGAVTIRCSFTADARSSQCGEGIFLMGGGFGGRVFFADLNPDETMELGRNTHSVAQILEYFGISWQNGEAKAG